MNFKVKNNEMGRKGRVEGFTSYMKDFAQDCCCK